MPCVMLWVCLASVKYQIPDFLWLALHQTLLDPLSHLHLSKGCDDYSPFFFFFLNQPNNFQPVLSWQNACKNCSPSVCHSALDCLGVRRQLKYFSPGYLFSSKHMMPKQLAHYYGGYEAALQLVGLSNTFKCNLQMHSKEENLFLITIWRKK